AAFGFQRALSAKIGPVDVHAPIKALGLDTGMSDADADVPRFVHLTDAKWRRFTPSSKGDMDLGSTEAQTNPYLAYDLSGKPRWVGSRHVAVVSVRDPVTKAVIGATFPSGGDEAYRRKRLDFEHAWRSAPDRGIAYATLVDSGDGRYYADSENLQVRQEPWDKRAFLLFGHSTPQFFMFLDNRYGAMKATGGVYGQIVEDWFLHKTKKTLGKMFTEAVLLTCSPAALDGPGSAAFDAFGKMTVQQFFGSTTATATGRTVFLVTDGGRFKQFNRAADGSITATVVEPGPAMGLPQDIGDPGLKNAVVPKRLVAVAEIDMVRSSAPVNEVRTSNDRGQVHFDVRRIEFDGVTVREISLELRTNFATVSVTEQAAFWSALDGVVEAWFNTGLELPDSGDQLRVRLIRSDKPTAHATVFVGGNAAWRESRTLWTSKSAPEVLAQHVADLLGAFDASATPWTGLSLTEAQLTALDDQYVPGGLQTLAHNDLPDNTEVLWVSGTDSIGRPRRFTTGQVAKTLVQRDGKDVGALFTTDGPSAGKWISMRQRASAIFLHSTAADKVLPVTIGGVDDDSTSVFVLHGNTQVVRLEVDSIGHVHVRPEGFVDVAQDTGILSGRPDGSLVVIWSCNIAAPPEGHSFLYDVQQVLASRNFRRRVAGGTTTVGSYRPTAGRGDGTKPSLSVFDSGHIAVVGDTTTADDVAIVAELVSALENEWSYADRGPIPANAKIPIGDRAGTLKLVGSVVDAARQSVPQRGGDLDLTAVHEAALAHQRPDLVETAVLAYIAAHQEDFPAVSSMTTAKFSKGAWRTTALSDLVRARFTVTGKAVWDSQELRRPIRLVPLGETAPALTAATVPAAAEFVPASGGAAYGALAGTPEKRGALDEFARTLVEIAIENTADGIPLPDVRIVGYGRTGLFNDAEAATRAGTKQAEKAHSELYAAVRRYLSIMTPRGAAELSVDTVLRNVHVEGATVPYLASTATVRATLTAEYPQSAQPQKHDEAFDLLTRSVAEVESRVADPAAVRRVVRKFVNDVERELVSAGPAQELADRIGDAIVLLAETGVLDDLLAAPIRRSDVSRLIEAVTVMETLLARGYGDIARSYADAVRAGGLVGIGRAGLTSTQINALAIAVNQGASLQEDNKALALAKIRDLNRVFGTTYPVDDPDQMALILDAVHLHLESMPLARNVDFGRTPSGVPVVPGRHRPTGAEFLTSSDHFPNFWESGFSTAPVHAADRGWVEEQFGYGAVLGRTAGDPAKRRDRTSGFAPPVPGELPAYAALNSGVQHAGAFAYGSSVLHLKEEVRNRTTYTARASATHGAGGVSSYTDGRHLFGLLAHGHDENVRLALADITGFRYDSELRMRVEQDGYAAVGWYIEAQIHGGMSWGDVRQVVVNWGDLFGQKQKNTTLEEAEGMVEYLSAFAVEHGYDFTVSLGQEIGLPSGLEAAEKERALALFGIAELGALERKVIRALDRLAKPTPFPSRADQVDLLDLASRAGIDVSDQEAALSELWRRAADVVPAGDVDALRQELGLGSPGEVVALGTSGHPAMSETDVGIDPEAARALVEKEGLAGRLTASSVRSDATAVALQEIVDLVAASDTPHQVAKDLAAAHGQAQLFGLTDAVLSRDDNAKVLGGVLAGILTLLTDRDAERMARSFELLDRQGQVHNALSGSPDRLAELVALLGEVEAVLPASSAEDPVAALNLLAAKASAEQTGTVVVESADFEHTLVTGSAGARRTPLVDPEVEARWTGSFALAKGVVDGEPDREALLEQAIRVVTARHATPAPVIGVGHPNDIAYRRVYEGIVYLVANRLRIDSGLTEAERLRKAEEMSEELREAFGSKRTSGGYAGARGAEDALHGPDAQRTQEPQDEWRVERVPGVTWGGLVVPGQVLDEGEPRDVRITTKQVPHTLQRHGGKVVGVDLLGPDSDSTSGLRQWLLTPGRSVTVVLREHGESRIISIDLSMPSSDSVFVVAVRVTGSDALVHVPGLGDVRVGGFTLAHLLRSFGVFNGYPKNGLVVLAGMSSPQTQQRYERLAEQLQRNLVKLDLMWKVAAGSKPVPERATTLLVPDGGYLQFFGGNKPEYIAMELSRTHKARWTYQPGPKFTGKLDTLTNRAAALRLMSYMDPLIEDSVLRRAEALVEVLRKLRLSATPDVADVLLLALAHQHFKVRSFAALAKLMAQAPVSAAEFDEVRDHTQTSAVRAAGVKYDIARVEVYPGAWVREAQLKIRPIFGHDTTPTQRDAFWRDLVIGVDSVFRPGTKLPVSADQFRVQVLYASEDAHVTMNVGKAWNADALGALVADLLGGSLAEIEDLTKAIVGTPYAQLQKVVDWNRQLISGRDAAGRERRFPASAARSKRLGSRGLVFPTVKGTWSPEVLEALATSGVHEARLTRQGRTLQAGPQPAGFDLIVVNADQHTAVVTVAGVGEVRINGMAFAGLVTPHLREGRDYKPALLLTPYAGAQRRAGGFAFDLAKGLAASWSKAWVAAATHEIDVVLEQRPVLKVLGGGHLNLFPMDADAELAEIQRALEAGWVYAPDESKLAVEQLTLADRAATIALIHKVVERIRALVTGNDGLLHLDNLYGEVQAKHAQADVVVSEALRYIANAHPGLRDQITAVVDQVLGKRGLRFAWVRVPVRSGLFTATGKAYWVYQKGEVRRPVRLGTGTDAAWDFSALNTVIHFDTTAQKPVDAIKDGKELKRLAISLAEILVEHSDPDRPLPVLQLTGYGRMAASSYRQQEDVKSHAEAKARQRATNTLTELSSYVDNHVKLIAPHLADRKDRSFNELVRRAEIYGVVEPRTADRAKAARVEITIVASETLLQERRDRGDVAGLVKLMDGRVQLARTTLIDLARRGNAEALQAFLASPGSDVRAIAELAAAGVT
ncbi:hypothetical protein SAMN04488564_12321, partial [Lentzea waywayandensis]